MQRETLAKLIYAKGRVTLSWLIYAIKRSPFITNVEPNLFLPTDPPPTLCQIGLQEKLVHLSRPLVKRNHLLFIMKNSLSDKVKSRTLSTRWEKSVKNTIFSFPESIPKMPQQIKETKNGKHAQRVKDGFDLILLFTFLIDCFQNILLWI